MRSSLATEPVIALPAGRGRPVWALGLGAFGLAFAITTTAAYLPPLLGRFTDSETLIALVLAAEGIFALALPVVIGSWSDTFHTPLGRRRPFMLVALGPMGFCLALLAFMPSLWTTALLVFAFFFASYVYEPPYRGLYPDLLPERIYGRAQGVQHVLRGIAIGGALAAAASSSARSSRPPRAAPRSCSSTKPAGTGASSGACAATSRRAGASFARSPTYGGSCSPTPPGRRPSPPRARLSSST